jgi:hypothetical protein
VIDVLAEIAAQLAWRGPSGKPQGHVVLDRAQAQELLRLATGGHILPPLAAERVHPGGEPRIIAEGSDGDLG